MWPAGCLHPHLQFRALCQSRRVWRHIQASGHHWVGVRRCSCLRVDLIIAAHKQLPWFGLYGWKCGLVGIMAESDSMRICMQGITIMASSAIILYNSVTVQLPYSSGLEFETLSEYSLESISVSLCLCAWHISLLKPWGQMMSLYCWLASQLLRGEWQLPLNGHLGYHVRRLIAALSECSFPPHFRQGESARWAQLKRRPRCTAARQAHSSPTRMTLQNTTNQIITGDSPYVCNSRFVLCTSVGATTIAENELKQTRMHKGNLVLRCDIDSLRLVENLQSGPV